MNNYAIDNELAFRKRNASSAFMKQLLTESVIPTQEGSGSLIFGVNDGEKHIEEIQSTITFSSCVPNGITSIFLLI